MDTVPIRICLTRTQLLGIDVLDPITAAAFVTRGECSKICDVREEIAFGF
jgi:hypothetical protein